jgi:hypothetical protein
VQRWLQQGQAVVKPTRPMRLLAHQGQELVFGSRHASTSPAPTCQCCHLLHFEPPQPLPPTRSSPPLAYAHRPPLPTAATLHALTNSRFYSQTFNCRPGFAMDHRCCA